MESSIIQFYLLNKALKTTEESFSRNVSNALVEVCEKLREIEVDFYRNKFKDLFGPHPVIGIDFKSMIVDDQRHEEYVCIHSQAVAKLYTPISELNKKIAESSTESILYKGLHGKNRHYKIDDIHDSFKRVSQHSFTEDSFTLEEYIRYKGNDQPIDLNQLARKAVERSRLIVQARQGFITENYKAQPSLIICRFRTF